MLILTDTYPTFTALCQVLGRVWRDENHVGLAASVISGDLVPALTETGTVWSQ